MGYRHHQALFILYCSVPIDCCYHDISSSSMFTKGEVVVKRKHGELTSFTNNERFNKTQPTSLSLHFSQPQHVILEDFGILYWLWVSQQLGLKVWIASAAAAHTQTTRYPTTFRWGSPHSKPILCSKATPIIILDSGTFLHRCGGYLTAARVVVGALCRRVDAYEKSRQKCE
jgi:hypothetical protein